MGCEERKPVVGVSDQVISKQACSATENSKILPGASLDMMLYDKRITKALNRLPLKERYDQSLQYLPLRHNILHIL